MAVGTEVAPAEHVASVRRLDRWWISRAYAGTKVALRAATQLRLRPWSRSIGLLVAGQLVLGLVIAGTTAVLVLNLREHALSAADRELRSTSLLLADQAERAFEAVDLVETALVDRLQNDDIRRPQDFRQLMSSFVMFQELRNRASTLPQLEAITVIDSDGDLINFSRSWPIPPVNVADRDYFAALKNDPDRTTFVSAPVKNRGSGTWTIYLARKVSGPDHMFLGLILAAIPLRFFEQLYQDVATGPDAAISMFRQDGVLLVRYPRNDQQIGRSFGQTLAFLKPEAAATNSIVVRKISEVDGRERLIAARSLVRYPLGINAMNSIRAILREWRKQATYLIATAVILELLTAVVGMLMLRHLRGNRMLNEARAAKAQAEAGLSVAYERERGDRELRTHNLRFAAALGNMSQALCMFDSDDRLIMANSRLAEMFGLPHDRVVPGADIGTLLGSGTPGVPVAEGHSLRNVIHQLCAGGIRAARVLDLADGRILAVSFVPMEDDGWLITLEDITEPQMAQARISHMAQHDALTGLPNRLLFNERLGEAVARSARGEMSAVLYLDLDHFKSVNDTLGHPVGDVLLQVVTKRLQDQVRETDTIARLGGDEFAVVQSGVDQPQNATVLARRLIDTIREPYEIDGHQVIIATSIGIAVVPTDGTDPTQILKNADMALYRAKANGRDRYHFFEPEMDALMQARRALEIDLRRALAADEFVLYYQPLMNIGTGSVVGFEALLRWVHPERGLVPPTEFIPLAEEIGLLVPLGGWVLRRACRDAASWPAGIKVAVNVSVTQFTGGTLVEEVAAALRDAGLHASRLELEITETVMLEDTDDILRILKQIRLLGVGIALDDFGTGYSSLSYLRRFPFTKVKIDRSFIEGLGKNADADAIVTAIIDLCRTLGMIVLAEGVETAEQLERLRIGNCMEAQGYLFSRPRPVGEVAELCRVLSPPRNIRIADRIAGDNGASHSLVR